MQELQTKPAESRKIYCGECGFKEAEIFQVVGDYCLECWQEVTHSDV